MTLLVRLRERLARGIRHRVTLLGAMILAMLLASGMLAFTTNQNAFFLLFSLLLAAVMVSSFLNRLVLAGLAAEISLAPHPVAGEAVPVVLLLRNTKSFLGSYALEVRPEGARPMQIPVLGPGAQYRHEFLLTWPRRGKPAPLEVILETRFPFGFSVRRAHLRVEVPGVIYPSLEEKPGHREILERALVAESAGHAAEESEFSHLRQYQEGDPFRHIAWAATARQAAGEGPLVSAQVRTAATGWRLWLDGGSPYWEEAVQLAAYLVWNLHYKKREFVFAGPAEIPVNTAADTYTVLKLLAELDADPGCTLPNDSSLFVISYRPGFLPPPVGASDSPETRGR